MKELKEFTVERLEYLASHPRKAVTIGGEELAALAKIALAAKQVRTGRSQCVKCGGEGVMDSGGTQPWGEPISVECDCTTPPLNHTEQHMAVPDGWIKCSDQLPPDDDFVLIWPLPDFGVDLHVGQYMKFHKKGAGWFAQVNEQNYGVEWYPIAVTHWIKLPSAPKPEM